MFGFLVRKKKDDVRTLFAGYVNRNAVRRVGDGQRKLSRGPFCEVVWLIPLDPQSREPLFHESLPVVTKDICQEGLALLHTRPLTDELVLIGLEGDVSMRYVVCRVEHSTPMGYGFHQIGMQPVQMLDLTPAEEGEFLRRRQLFTDDEA